MSIVFTRQRKNLFNIWIVGIAGFNLTLKEWFVSSWSAKLILAVVHHALGYEWNFSLQIVWNGLKQHFFYIFISLEKIELLLVPEPLYKKDCIRELCKTSFEYILSKITWNSTSTQKRIISASIKTSSATK